MFTIGWLIWLAYFLALEGVALYRSQPGDTLSEHVWQWFTVGAGKPRNGWARFRRFALLAFMVWLTAHFLTGGWV